LDETASSPLTDREKLQALFNKQLFFQDATQPTDLMDPTITQDCLISFLLDLLSHGFHIEITAVKTDHHDDSALGLYCHFNGYAIDCWNLTGPVAGDYVDAGTQTFRTFLETAASNPYLYQIGLAGSADTPVNETVAGPTVFSDDGGDHVHFGSQPIKTQNGIDMTEMVGKGGVITSVVTAHWSATSPARLKDYHVEFALTGTLDPAYNLSLGQITDPTKIDWVKLKSLFTIWKNFQFGVSLDYGTYDWNHAMSGDQSPNIEIGALCMGGEGVNVIGPWGKYPYTFTHAWIHAAIIARVCKVKNLNPLQSFNDPGKQNPPQYVVSTHAERACQTPDQGADTYPERGYGPYSGDPDMRWDIAARDVSDAGKLNNWQNAHTELTASANWLRQQSQAIINMGIIDLWAMDQDVTP